MRTRVVLILVLVLVLGVAAGAALVPASSSSPVLSAAESAPEGLPWQGTPGVPARSLASVNSTYDRVRGTWINTATFYAPQSASSAATLYLSLTTLRGSGFAFVQLHTNPTAPRTGYFLDPGMSSGVRSLPGSAPTVSTAFSADRKSVTVRVQDRGLIGKPFDRLGVVRLSKNNLKFDLFPGATLSANGDLGPAPSISLPTSDSALQVRGSEIDIELSAVTLPVSIAVFVKIGDRVVAANGTALAGLPRSLAAYLLPIAARLLPRGKQRAGRLIVLLYSDRGRTTVLSRPVTITASA